MKRHGMGVAFVALLALSLAACNRGKVAAIATPAKTPTVRPTQPTPQPVAAVTTAAPANSPAVPAANPAPPPAALPENVTASEHSQSFVIAGRTYTFVSRVQKIDGTQEQTVEWWELRDADNKAVYRQSYPVSIQNNAFENTVDVSASAFTAKGGSGILISGMDLPSAPDSGGWVQVFGFKYGRDKYGADLSLFGPFGPPISIEGDFLGVEADSYRPTPVAFGRTSEVVTRDVMKFRLWTGNFNIVYPVLINWITGKLQPAWRCPENTSKGTVDRCSYAMMAEGQRPDQPTFVRLFPEPDDGFTPKHVIVQPHSKIEYLEARTPVTWNEDANSISFSANGDVWVKIRIDGQEGWIHSEEDFEAVGLPQSG